MTYVIVLSEPNTQNNTAKSSSPIIHLIMFDQDDGRQLNKMLICGQHSVTKAAKIVAPLWSRSCYFPTVFNDLQSATGEVFTPKAISDADITLFQKELEKYRKQLKTG